MPFSSLKNLYSPLHEFSAIVPPVNAFSGSSLSSIVQRAFLTALEIFFNLVCSIYFSLFSFSLPNSLNCRFMVCHVNSILLIHLIFDLTQSLLICEFYQKNSLCRYILKFKLKWANHLLCLRNNF